MKNKISSTPSKGRSSAFCLNEILRSLLPYLLFGDIAVALLWVETASNLADHPSRFVPVPPPGLRWKMARSAQVRWNSGARVQGLGFRAQGSGFRVQGLRFVS